MVNLKKSVVMANKTVCDWLRQNFSSIHPISVWMEEGFFKEQDLLDISCYWLQFKPIKKSLHFLFGTILAVLFVVALISNATALYIIISSKLKRNPANILLANLAISDLAILIVIPIFVFNSFLQGPAIGGFGCKMYGFLGGLSGTSSICTLAAIAIERYLVINRSLAKKPNRSWSFKMIFFIWIYSAFFASLPLFGFGQYVPEGYLTSCSFDYLSDDIGTRIFILSYFIGAWVCPLAVITFCYAFIIRTVFKFRKNIIGRGSKFLVRRGQRNISLHRSTASSIASTNRNQRILKRGANQPNVDVAVAKVLIKLVVVWVTAWTPYSIVSLLGISGFSRLLTPFNSMVPALFAKTAACVDPFIYSLKHPQVRKEILRRMNNSLQTLAGPSALPPNKLNSNFSVRSRQGVTVSQKSNAHHPCVSSSATSSHRRRARQENSVNSLTLSRKNARSAVVGNTRSLSIGSRSESIPGLETNKGVSRVKVEIDLHGQCRRLLAVPETYKTPQRSPSTSFAEFHRQSNKSLLLTASSYPIQSSSV